MTWTATTSTPSETQQLASDVRHYLTSTPKQLPSHALYDALGSALFDAICELPWYPLTRAERRLIERYRSAILAKACSPARLVELGCGNGSKLEALLGSVDEARCVQRVDLIDISPTALRDAARRLSENCVVNITTHAMRYEEGLDEIARTPRQNEPMLVLFLGSNIGNFDPPGAATFLARIRRSMRQGDGLLIGADLVKPEATLLAAYDDPLGVTAAFNKNLLVHLNATLGANFDVTAFAHRAVWNARDCRVEMHLVSRVTQRVDIPLSAVSIELKAGEAIWTESSYKYTVPTFDAALAAEGLQVAERWVDREGQFLLSLAVAG